MCHSLRFIILYITAGKPAQQGVFSHLLVEAAEARGGEETRLQGEAGI